MTTFFEKKGQMKKKKKKYVGEKVKLFMDFLPDEIFYSFTDEEKQEYRNYRRYQRFIGESNLRVQKYQKEIEKLKKKISEEKIKVKGTEEEEGWEKKMEFYYNKVSHLDKNLKLNCSIENRRRSSVSQKLETKEIKYNPLKRDKNKKTTENFKYYGRVESLSNRKDFYFGTEIEMRKGLEEIFSEDWSKDDFDFVKDELKSLMSQFSRYHIFKSNWNEFKVGTYNMKTLVDWSKWCEENGVDRYEWGGKR